MMNDLSCKATSSTRGAAAMVALALACQGCAHPSAMGPVAPIVSEVEVSVHESVVPGADIQASVVQSDSMVEFSATERCDLHRIRTVDQVRWKSNAPSQSSSGSANGLVWAAGLIVASGLITGGLIIIGKAQERGVVNPDAKMVNGAALGLLSVGVLGMVIWATSSSSAGAPGVYKATDRPEVDDGLVRARSTAPRRPRRSPGACPAPSQWRSPWGSSIGEGG